MKYIFHGIIIVTILMIWYYYYTSKVSNPSESTNTLKKYFPNSVPVPKAYLNIIEKLDGKDETNTQFAHSTCSDEINHKNNLHTKLSKYFGGGFHLGGLTGIPFTGKAGIDACIEHIPKDGYLFILFGPHIGIDKDGQLGKVNRIGQDHSTHSCKELIECYNGTLVDDHQMKYVSNKINIFPKGMNQADLTLQYYKVIEEEIKKLTAGKDNVILCGGIFINMPEKDYFQEM